jgi:Sec-independent protein translocase protein TatA
MMLRYILIGFAIYFGYRFLFDFLLPLIKTTRQVKKQFDAVKEQQQEFFRQQSRQQQQRQPESAKKSASAADDDYIDFEEVK